MRLVGVFSTIAYLSYLVFCNVNKLWNNHIRDSISYNLHNDKSTLLHMLAAIKSKYKHIRSVCHTHSFGYCNGNLRGLCGSERIVTDRLMNCVWELQVPQYFSAHFVRHI